MTIQFIPIEIQHLLFDPDNPRLPEGLGADQRKIFRFLVDDIGVDDVLNSMAASGVIDGDPMIGRLTEQTGSYYVIEGNRRLAALKLLTGERIGDGGSEPALPALSTGVAQSLTKVNLQVGWDQDKLEAYLGYKHVTAAREWTPEAKAKFVLSHCGSDFSDPTLSKFAQRLGTKLPTLRRWLVAYLALKQAETKGKFSPEEAYAKRYFGTFYTLLGSQQVQDFLALKSGPLTTDPVPEDHLEQLGEFVGWVIGTKKSPPIVNSRSQEDLNAVLASPGALQYFRSKKNLDHALLYTEYNSGRIAEKLATAAYTIEECLPKVFDVREDPKVQAAIANLNVAIEKLRRMVVEERSMAKKRK
jgi:hypothetical protein